MYWIVATVAFLVGGGTVWWLHRQRSSKEDPGPPDLAALGSGIFAAVANRDFLAYQRLYVNPYRLESEPYRKGFARVCGKVPREARYEGLLVEQNGRAFLRISLPSKTMHEIQVGKAVKLKNAYKLDDPVKGGRINRDLDTVDIPTARPVMLQTDRLGLTPPPVGERSSSHYSSPGRRRS